MTATAMKLWLPIGLLIFIVLVSNPIQEVDGISIGVGNLLAFPKISTSQGLLVILLLLPYYLAEEFGLLPINFSKLSLRFWSRKLKRDVSSINYFQSDAFFEQIRMADTNDCVLRYICELPEGDHMDNLLEFFLFRLATNYDSKSGPMIDQKPFQKAFSVGRKNLKACSVHYKDCPHDLNGLRGFVRDHTS